MFLLDSLLINGLEWVFDKVRVVAETEMDDESHLRASLLEAQTQLESGELSEAEYADRERDLLARISAARRRRQGEESSASDYRVTGADVGMTGDDDQR